VRVHIIIERRREKIMPSKKPKNDKENAKNQASKETNLSHEAPAAPETNDPPEPPRHTYRQVESQETFDYQPTSTKELPDPKAAIDRMVAGVLETVHGLRDPRQLARWVSYEVYTAVQARARGVRRRYYSLNGPPARPIFALGNVVIGEPRDGVVEAAAIVHGPTRVRAVALRLEGLDDRWMMTSFRML